jgi:hypothetical protein
LGDVTTGSLTLAEFWLDAPRQQQSARERGLVDVFFFHQVLTAQTARAVWRDVPRDDVPAVGAVVDLPGAGYMGAGARWQIMDQQWTPGAAVFLHVRDAPSSAESSAV